MPEVEIIMINSKVIESEIWRLNLNRSLVLRPDSGIDTYGTDKDDSLLSKLAN